jgi:hypothetical protein
VLLLSEANAEQDQVADFVRVILATEYLRIRVKVRPGEVKPPILAALPGAAIALDENDLFAAFEDCSVVLGTYSTALYEAIFALRPAVVLATRFSYGHQIALDGLADMANTPEQVQDVIRNAAQTTADELLRRRRVVWGEPSQAGAGVLLDTAEATLWS